MLKTRTRTGIILMTTVAVLTVGLVAAAQNFTVVGSSDLKETKFGAKVCVGCEVGSMTGGAEHLLSVMGNVGIGTTAPGARLHVMSDGSIAIRAQGDGTLFQASDGVDFANYVGVNATDNFMWLGGAQSDMAIKSGNVGIGTTAPGERLDISGKARTSGGLVYNAGDGAQWWLTGTASGPAVMLQQHSSVAGNSYRRGSLGWMDNYGNKSEILTWGLDGNVGIGTTTPGSSTKLNVTGRGLFTGGSFDPGDGSPAGVGISFSGTYGAIQVVQTGFTSYPLLLQYYGNVGIGTTAPSAKLEVAGNALFSGSSVVQVGSGSTAGFIKANPSYWTGFDVTSGGRFVTTVTGTQASGPNNVWDIERNDTWEHLMELRADGSAFFKGNVGIGTSTPAAKLHVSGGNLKVSGDVLGSFKLCACVAPGNWRDAIPVPTGWTGTTCQSWCSSVGGVTGTLVHATESGYVTSYP